MQKSMRGLVDINGVWHIDKQVDGIRICKTTKTSNFDEAIQIMEREVHKATLERYPEYWVDYVGSMTDDRSSWLHYTYRKMKIRSIKSQREFTITFPQFKAKVMQSEGRSALTGIYFSDEKPAWAKAAPFSISVDRIDSNIGYTFDNVRLVCLAVNLAMREWGDGVLEKIGKAFLLKQLLSETAGKHENLTAPQKRKPQECG